MHSIPHEGGADAMLVELNRWEDPSRPFTRAAMRHYYRRRHELNLADAFVKFNGRVLVKENVFLARIGSGVDAA